MVECDKCHAWQHGNCMGYATIADAPADYFCEKCRPDLWQDLIQCARCSSPSPPQHSLYSRHASYQKVCKAHTPELGGLSSQCLPQLEIALAQLLPETTTEETQHHELERRRI